MALTAAQSKSAAGSKIPQEHFLGISYIDVPTSFSDNSLSGPTKDPLHRGTQPHRDLQLPLSSKVGTQKITKERKGRRSTLDTEDAGRVYPISGVFSKLRNGTSFSTWGKIISNY